MKFTEECWTAVGGTFARISTHPFITELAAGRLSREAFVRYIQQDDLYILDDARALALAGVRAPNPDEMLLLLGQSYESLRIEKSMHDEIFAAFGVKPAGKKSRACEAYTGYLVNTALAAPYEISVASLLPCFWVYHETGILLADTSADKNPYRLWIETYGGEEFAMAVMAMRDLTDRVAERSSRGMRELMLEAFIRSTEYELLFYESAYRGDE